ncbi:ROK family protein [Plantibacter sp. YIM 135347]|uniref:ROK family protein n=1 Tax=Plantibacter sp. YIM 135347 TaxID=3423919 RepID=UPI003D33CE45
MTTDTFPDLGDSSRGLAREVLIHGPIARGELGRRLGLSPASLTRLSKPFLDRGLFVEGPEHLDGAVGRPAKPLDVRIDAQRFIGIKLTGDQALGVVTDLRANALGTAIADLRGHEPADALDAIGSIVDALSSEIEDAPLSAIGVSIGGKVLDSRIVTRAPFLEWRGIDLGGLIEERFGVPATVENDVVALTEAEHWFGRARGIANFAVITTGAGVGYGLVIHGRQVTTPDTGLGLGGHFPLDPTGPLCVAGHRGCSSAMLSIPAMCSAASVGIGREVGYDELLSLAADAVDDSRPAASPASTVRSTAAATAVYGAPAAGQAVAAQVVQASGRALGRLIAAAANLAMVSTVVLSGEGIALAHVAEDAMRAALAADRDPDADPVDVIIGDPDFSAWARGAAAIAIQRQFAA